MDCVPWRYERIIADFLDSLGSRAEIDLGHIAPKDIEGFRDKESAAGKTASSVNAAIKALQVPFNVTRRQAIISTNPAEAVRLLPSDGEERMPFTTDQLDSLMKTADVEWKGSRDRAERRCAGYEWDQRHGREPDHEHWQRDQFQRNRHD